MSVKKLYMRPCTKIWAMNELTRFRNAPTLWGTNYWKVVWESFVHFLNGLIKNGLGFLPLKKKKAVAARQCFTHLVVLVHDRELPVHRPRARPILPCG